MAASDAKPVQRPTVSLTRRVILLSCLWSAVAVLILGSVLLGLYRASLMKSLDELQVAQLYAVIAAVSADGDGGLAGRPDLGDRNFLALASGWYWRVVVLDKPETAITSLSLDGEAIERADIRQVPFDDAFLRRFTVAGPHGGTVRVLETEVVLDDRTTALFQITANAGAIRAALTEYGRQIGGLLVVFVIGLVAINAIVILVGLRPLDQLRAALAGIQDGNARHLEGRFPAEIQPLATELNSLIDNNKRILDRSRMQVGNLAHSLKTPLAVMMNAGRAGSQVPSNLVMDQCEAMREQVQRHLDQARVAAQRDTALYRTEVVASLEPLLRVVRKLNPEKTFDLVHPVHDVRFAGEKEDLLEIVGNLLENAAKWSRARVLLTVSETGDEAGNPAVLITVDDDGPGIPAADRAAVLKRGTRLDETVPGTGLGLSIIVETATSYGGSLSLDGSEMGGLRATVRLPGLR